MGVQAQRKRMFDGMSARHAKVKLSEIWAKAHPGGVTLNRANKRFATEYNMGLLAICETWHRLRSQNKAVECMIHSFAETCMRKNATNHALGERIAAQRKQLEKLQNEFNRLKTDSGFVSTDTNQHPIDGGQGPVPPGLSSEKGV